MAQDERERMSRRQLIISSLRTVGLLVGAGALGGILSAEAEPTVWQIDPDKCIACGKCATACVITPSAVKAVHDVPICGYCDLCFGYFAEQRPGDTETAENLRCPTDAIIRNFVEEPYYEYLIDEPKCIGCGSCVEGCNQYGNGSLILQVRHDRCKNCNECAIAVQCPADAFVRVPASDPYLLRSTRLEQKPEAEEPTIGSAPERQVQPPQPTQPTPSPSNPPEVAPQPNAAPTPPPAQQQSVDSIDIPGGLDGGGLQPVTPSPPGEAGGTPTGAEGQADSLREMLGVDEL